MWRSASVALRMRSATAFTSNNMHVHVCGMLYAWVRSAIRMRVHMCMHVYVCVSEQCPFACACACVK